MTSDEIREDPTLDEIRRWPATVSPAVAATALGISRSYCYELVRRGQFPVKVLRVGGKTRVVTAAIIAALEADNPATGGVDAA
ncbi:hypothetical protein GCM10023196_053810 [Actinoallomurus vinaceus]|uniref:Helix-turn-helix domain-containing protein n=1 Tax=Actinoallomurus vinaceus TaxID=1080074 RepID=A0ABP8UHJ2_9ACTN